MADDVHAPAAPVDLDAVDVGLRTAADMHAKRAEAASVRVRIWSRLSLLQDDAADYRLVSEEVAGKLIGDGWDDDAA